MNDGFVAAMLFIGGLVIGVAIMMIVWSTNVEGAIKTRFSLISASCITSQRSVSFDERHQIKL